MTFKPMGTALERAALYGALVLVMRYCQIVQANVMTESSNSSCSRRCTMVDRSADCWEESVVFYTERVQDALRDYAALLANMHRWRETLPELIKEELTTDLSSIEDAALNVTIERYNERSQEERAPFDEEDLRTIFNVLLNLTRQRMNHYVEWDNLPPYVSCPLECDYYPHVWSLLALTLAVCLVLQGIVFLLYASFTSRRLDTDAKHQLLDNVPYYN